MKTTMFLKNVLSTVLFMLMFACSTSDPAPTPPTPTSVTAQTTAVSTTGFTLSFDVAVPELTADNFVMTPKVTSVTPDASNKIYTIVTSPIAAGSSFTVSFKKDGYTFSPETLTINVPNAGDVAITAKVSSITTNGFTMTFDKAVADFAASNIKLDNSATVTSITAVGTDNKVFTVVSTLTAGTTYNATLTKTGFSFIPQPLQIIVPAPAVVAVTTTVSNPSTTGFTLTFDKAIASFAKTDITLAPAATITSATAVVGSDNKVFAVAVPLTAGTSYTATLSKTGYTFTGTLTFTATVPPKSFVVTTTGLWKGVDNQAVILTPSNPATFDTSKTYTLTGTGTTCTIAAGDVTVNQIVARCTTATTAGSSISLTLGGGADYPAVAVPAEAPPKYIKLGASGKPLIDQSTSIAWAADGTEAASTRWDGVLQTSGEGSLIQNGQTIESTNIYNTTPNTWLWWEVKDVSGTRIKTGLYSNYDNIADYTQEQIDAATNSIGFKNAVNTVGLCGKKDWRIPRASELLSIINFPGSSPYINLAFFPNIGQDSDSIYYSSSTVDKDHSESVSFKSAGTIIKNRIVYAYIFLVRSNQ